MIRDTNQKIVIENPHGGMGKIEKYEVLTSADTLDHVSLMAKVILHPQSIIGYHQHLEEAEAYYVLKGSGYFINSQRERIAVKAGDVCLIEVGGSHGMENLNDEEMIIMAIVYPK